MAEYVEREQTINFARASAAAAYNRDDFYAYRGLNAFIATLVSIPAADVAPVRHGHWIRFKENDSCYVHMRCSACSAYWSDPSHADYFRFCPNCGAKMDTDSEEESEDDV